MRRAAIWLLVGGFVAASLAWVFLGLRLGLDEYGASRGTRVLDGSDRTRFYKPAARIHLTSARIATTGATVRIRWCSNRPFADAFTLFHEATEIVVSAETASGVSSLDASVSLNRTLRPEPSAGLTRGAFTPTGIRPATVASIEGDRCVAIRAMGVPDEVSNGLAWARLAVLREADDAKPDDRSLASDYLKLG